MDKGNQAKHSYIYGTGRVIIDAIKDQFNIITIGAGSRLENNYYKINRHFSDCLFRKSQDLNYQQRNETIIRNAYAIDFKDLPAVDYILLGTDDFFRLPLRSYCPKKLNSHLAEMQNEYFDYLGDDPKILDVIEEVNVKVVSNWFKNVSPIAFSTKDYSMFMSAIDFINQTNRLKKKVIAFAIDPTIFTPFFELNGIDATFYYFANDTRGTRNFTGFDISQFQYIIHDKEYDMEYNNEEKTHNMFFAGTIFQDKGYRRFIWDDFLADVKSDDCAYYIPLRKNGIVWAPTGANQRQLDVVQELFPRIYDEILNSKHFKASVPPATLNGITSKYKYGMVFRCVSVNDSLNFRPALYAYLNIIPFLDYEYDPDCLHIPASIQNRLIVRNAQDIDDKIEYFNRNESERLKLLRELRELFRIDEYENNKRQIVADEIKKIIPEFKGE